MSQTICAVTIGMPVYNGATYIRDALDSLLAQTLSNFELIISDNASTDATQSICEEYARLDSRIRYVRQNENRGALANFQFVLDQARGEFFMWAAADDLWEKNWIECLKDALIKSDVGAAFGRLMHIDENAKSVKHLANGRTFEFRGSKLWRRIRYFIEFERYGKANPIYSLFRRRILGGLDIASYFVDFHIVFNILVNTEIIPVPHTVIYKRVHPASEGERREQGIGAVVRRFSYLFMPVDIGFVCGYFKQSVVAERFLFVMLLPIKFIFGYAFYLRLLVLRLKRLVDLYE